MIHGDKDPLVPLQQSERMIDKLKQAGVETNLSRTAEISRQFGGEAPLVFVGSSHRGRT